MRPLTTLLFAAGIFLAGFMWGHDLSEGARCLTGLVP